MSDEQWEIVRPLLFPERKGPGRPPELNLRRVADTIFYVVRTGYQWKNLPKDYPNCNSVYYYYGRWRDGGTWRRVNETLLSLPKGHQERERMGRKPEHP